METPKPELDPIADIPDDIKARVDAALDKTYEPPKVEMLLERDTTLPAGQNFAIISFCGPTMPQKHDQFCLKIKGVYDTEDQARVAAKKMQSADPTYVLGVIGMGEWGVYPPDFDRIADQEYADDKLNEILGAHDKENERTKWYYETRKEMLKSNVDVNKILKEANEAAAVHPAEAAAVAEGVSIESADTPPPAPTGDGAEETKTMD